MNIDMQRRRGRPPKLSVPQVETSEVFIPDDDWRGRINTDPTLSDDQKFERMGWTVCVRCRVNEVHTGDTRVLTFGDEAWVTPEVADILCDAGQAVEVATR